jgi:hypothetical protein
MLRQKLSFALQESDVQSLLVQMNNHKNKQNQRKQNQQLQVFRSEMQEYARVILLDSNYEHFFWGGRYQAFCSSGKLKPQKKSIWVDFLKLI